MNHCCLHRWFQQNRDKLSHLSLSQQQLKESLILFVARDLLKHLSVKFDWVSEEGKPLSLQCGCGDFTVYHIKDESWFQQSVFNSIQRESRENDLTTTLAIFFPSVIPFTRVEEINPWFTVACTDSVWIEHPVCGNIHCITIWFLSEGFQSFCVEKFKIQLLPSDLEDGLPRCFHDLVLTIWRQYKNILFWKGVTFHGQDCE